MKKGKLIIAAAAVAISPLLGACVGRTNDGEKARADYDRSLSDSIAVVEQEIDSCNTQIGLLRDQVNGWVRDFTTVSNPREAGSYMILTSFKDRYPLSSTGLVARINDNNQFELVAALSGKAFDRIEVQGPTATATSDVVPNDQALNYRTAALTTVMFTGNAADSIGALVADNQLNPITVTFMGNSPVQSWKLPESNAKMISYTYLLYKSNKELNRLERRVPMLHEKINLLRIHKDRTAPAADSAK